MSFISLFTIVLALASGVSSAIIMDLNCTTYDGTKFVYTPAAVACEDTIASASCQVLYADAGDGFPTAGEEFGRPFACYTNTGDDTGALIPDMKAASMSTCPRTCGYCCQTDAYNCPNVAFPRINCNTITRSQCTSVQWRPIIATDCPSACGFCNEGGCVDAVTNCGNDLSICNTVGMQDFVNTYCQRTCGRCPSTTASGSVTSTTGSSTGTCTSYIADSSTSCAAWAGNGFCTNTFYTEAQRRSRCATTCRIC